MGRKGIVLGLGILFLVSSMAFAAPVRIPGGKLAQGVMAKDTEGEAFLGGSLILGVGAEYDHVDKMKLKESSGEANYDSASGLISLTYDKKYSVYGVFGQMINPEVKATADDGTVGIADLDNAFMWGTGINGIIFEKEGYQLFADGSYTATADMDVNKVTIGSDVYTKADFVPGATATGKFEEWQVALGVTKDFEWIKPYVGVKYMDAKATANVSAGGYAFEGSTKNKDKVGVFVGATASPLKWLELNVQGRFVDETAVMGSATVKF